MTTYRIAVCLFGQPRTFNYCWPWVKQMYEHVSEITKVRRFNSFDPTRSFEESVQVEVDFFLHLKDYNSYIFKDIPTEETISSEELTQIVNKVAPKRYTIMSNSAEEAIGIPKRNWFFSPAVHPIVSAVNLKQQYEKETMHWYDACVLQRTDVITGPTTQTLADFISNHGVHGLTMYTENNSVFNSYDTFKTGVQGIFMLGGNLAVDVMVSNLMSSFNDDERTKKSDLFMISTDTVIKQNIQANNLNLGIFPSISRIIRPSDQEGDVFDYLVANGYVRKD